MLHQGQKVIIEVQQIVPEGKGFALLENTPIYVFGAFPGEKCEVNLIKKGKNFFEARLENILVPSKERVIPKDTHYLSSAPWAGINYNYQFELKKEILIHIYKSLAGYDLHNSINLGFVEAVETEGYRNKIEFSFTEVNSKIHLAFHKRGSYKDFLLADTGSSLASDKINECALNIVRLLNESEILEWDLKTLVIRYSRKENKCHSILFLKNKSSRVQNSLKNLIENNPNLTIAFSSPKSPASIINEVLATNDDREISEKLLGKTFKYSGESFFQGNIEMFEKTLKDLLLSLNDNYENCVELYAGVGAIGLSLSEKFKNITAIENIKEAVESATKNAQELGAKNYKSIFAEAEKVVDEIPAHLDVLIVDPPRIGLHKDVIQRINQVKPKKVIYLSCNPITQASNFNLLKDNYEIETSIMYDYYPNTPHMENLLILNLK